MRDIHPLDTVTVTGPTTIAVTWKGTGRNAEIDLASWIDRSSPGTAALKNPDVFARAEIGDYGAHISWDGEEASLAIDSLHLEMLADEQCSSSARAPVGRRRA